MADLSFSISTAERRNKNEAIEFEVNGQRFTATGSAPGGAMMALAGASLESKSPAERVATVGIFLDSVLLPESRDRFATLLLDPEEGVDLEATMEIIAELAKRYGGRPTEPPSLS